MVRRICPNCKTKWYSANTFKEIWVCQNCDLEIPKSEETTDINDDGGQADENKVNR